MLLDRSVIKVPFKVLFIKNYLLIEIEIELFYYKM